MSDGPVIQAFFDLAVPKLLLLSIEVNIRAGLFPEAESNGVR
jgi:hypothetical protein